MIAEHTRLTSHAFTSFSGTMLAIGLLNVGFGTIDLAMVAPLGIEQIAAVGLGDAVVVLVLAFAGGIVDIFTSRLAQAEGVGNTNARLPVLLAALALVLIPLQAIAIVVMFVLRPVLSLLGQSNDVVPLTGDYADARLLGLLLTLAMSVTFEILKVCGMRNWTVVALVAGLVLSVGLNWIVLYGPAVSWFSSPAAAVASSTVMAQACMAVFGIVVLVLGLSKRKTKSIRPTWSEVLPEALSIGKTGSGVGVRHLNDYVGSTVPFLLMGTLGVQTLAAVTVATRIWTLYCRIPQACFTASFIFYGYAMHRSRDEADDARRKLFRMSAWPTFIGALVFLAFSPFLVLLFAGPEVDMWPAVLLVVAYFICLVPYFYEAFYGELLTSHQEGTFLSVTSTVVTYVLVVPLAAIAVLVFQSAFLAIASITLATIPTAVLFTRRYFRAAELARSQAAA